MREIPFGSIATHFHAVKDTHSLHPELWMKRYFRSLLSYTLHRVGGDIHTARDIIQDTFLSALGTRELYKGRSSEKTWLYAILRHRIMDFYHDRGNKKVFSFSSLTANDAQAPSWEKIPDTSSALSAEYLTEKNDFSSLIMRCMDSLPERQALIFKLKYLYDMPTEEICLLCGVTQENCWVMIHRAKKRLRELLNEERGQKIDIKKQS